MNIVIPYRTTKTDDIELRYMLRSLEKNLSGFDGVIIVGDKPSWLKNVEHIPCEDFKGKKESSVANKLMKAAEITDKFCRFDDDHFLLKPLDVSEIKYWHSNPMSSFLKRSPSQYRDTILATIKIFGDEPYYDIHTPIVIDSKAYKQVMSDIVEEKKEVLIKTTYCLRAKVKGELQIEQDMKVNTAEVHWIWFEKILPKRTFITTGEHAVNLDFERVFSKLFPRKSKYE